jgi:hypothetical protein
MLQQRTPMNRGNGFKRPTYVPPPAPPQRPIVRKVSYAPPEVSFPVTKECALQHQGYINAVRGLPCARCGRAPRSQFCHGDMDKGMGIKTDCRRGWPGCPECHYFVGTSGTLPKEARRLLEAVYAQQTREKIIAAGLWPKRLPIWTESTQGANP